MKPIAGQEGGTQGFTMTADHEGDAVVVHVTCVNNTTTMMSLTGPWTFTPLSPLTSNACCTTQSFGGIVNTTTEAAFQLTTAQPCSEVVILGDEFTGNDPAGGITTFDDSNASASTFSAINVTTKHDHDAVWGAITSGGIATPGSGFTVGANNQGNITEWRLPGDAAGAVESVTFSNVGDCEITAVSIKPM